MIEGWVQKALSSNNSGARGARSDFDLNVERDEALILAEPVRPAAVLVPIVLREEAATILLTKRTEHLAKHAGQVSFPGGSVDDSDESAVAAALREAEEEIGLDAKYVNVIGSLDQYRTGTGFEITPVVATVTPGFDLSLQEEEVAEAFEVPFEFVLNRKNHQRQSAVWKGRRRHYYAMPYGDYFIWGATAAMLVNLVDVMEAVREQT